MFVDDLVEVAVVLLHLRLLLLERAQRLLDAAVEALRLLAQRGHRALQLAQEGVDLFLARVDLHRAALVEPHDGEALAGQQNGALLAVVEGLLLAIGDELGSLMRVVDAHILPLAIEVRPAHQARLSPPRPQRRERSLGTSPAGRITNVHLIYIVAG